MMIEEDGLNNITSFSGSTIPFAGTVYSTVPISTLAVSKSLDFNVGVSGFFQTKAATIAPTVIAEIVQIITFVMSD